MEKTYSENYSEAMSEYMQVIKQVLYDTMKEHRFTDINNDDEFFKAIHPVLIKKIKDALETKATTKKAAGNNVSPMELTIANKILADLRFIHFFVINSLRSGFLIHKAYEISRRDKTDIESAIELVETMITDEDLDAASTMLELAEGGAGGEASFSSSNKKQKVSTDMKITTYPGNTLRAHMKHLNILSP